MTTTSGIGPNHIFMTSLNLAADNLCDEFIEKIKQDKNFDLGAALENPFFLSVLNNKFNSPLPNRGLEFNEENSAIIIKAVFLIIELKGFEFLSENMPQLIQAQIERCLHLNKLDQVDVFLPQFVELGNHYLDFFTVMRTNNFDVLPERYIPLEAELMRTC